MDHPPVTSSNERVPIKNSATSGPAYISTVFEKLRSALAENETARKVMGAVAQDYIALRLPEAQALMNRRRFDEALTIYSEVAHYSEATIGPKDPVTAECLRLVSSVHQARGEYAQSVKLLRKALAIMEAAKGPDDRGTVVVRRDLGRLCSRVENCRRPFPSSPARPRTPLACSRPSTRYVCCARSRWGRRLS
jgi:tetratricopeptide (TPR) repeat protein